MKGWRKFTDDVDILVDTSNVENVTVRARRMLPLYAVANVYPEANGEFSVAEFDRASKAAAKEVTRLADELSDPARERLRIAAPEILELLREVQWGHGGDCDPGCPLCGAREHDPHHDRPAGKHAPGCRLGALLARIDGQGG